MSSKEQFDLTINHKQPDKVVIDFGSTGVTGMHVLIVEKLRNYYGLENKPVRVIEPFQMLGEVDEELQKVMGVDVTGAWGEDNMFGFKNLAPFNTYKTLWGQEVLVPENFNTTINQKGDVLMYPEGDLKVPPSAVMPSSGYFFDAIIRQQPIDDTNLTIEDNLQEYGLIEDSTLVYWKKESAKLRAKNKAVIAAFGSAALGDIAFIPGMQLKNPKGIRDITEWYMSTIMRVDYIKKVFDKQIELAIENYKRIHEVVGDNVDAVFTCGTDFGTQSSTFCSTEQFDDLWLPYYKRINDWVHQNTSWKTFKHSCGAVESFMPRFIEAGFDIINPVQINASGMNPKLLKEKYGKDVVFWGGGIDTQITLPSKSPSEVRDEVFELVDIFNKDGGFVFNTVHNIQANVPVENVVAMIDALKEINRN